MNESPGTFELLSARVDELEKRVHALEHPDEVKASSANRVIGAASAASDGGTDSLQTANIFPLLGRAMLGIAGAYVLRAVAEVGVMPKVLLPPWPLPTLLRGWFGRREGAESQGLRHWSTQELPQ